VRKNGYSGSSSGLNPWRQATALILDNFGTQSKSLGSLMMTISSLVESLYLPGKDPDFKGVRLSHLDGNFFRLHLILPSIGSDLTNRGFQGLLEGVLPIQGPGSIKSLEAPANSQAFLPHLG
jgi:hypothetical protein